MARRTTASMDDVATPASRSGRLCAWCAFCAVLFTSNAYSYVDPNSVGMIYQILFPIVVAITVAWRSVKRMFQIAWSSLIRKRR